MKVTSPSFRFLLPAALIIIAVVSAGSATTQKRDHLTDSESELIRYYRELDKRIEVFIKAVDRRFAVINGTTPPSSRKLFKDEPDWGELPAGSHIELLGDIAGILDEAITNIDDVARRDARNPLLSRSLKKLTTAANGYLNQLAILRNKTTDPDELAAIARVADNANEIIEAGGKQPAPSPEEKDKKKKP